MLAKLPHPFDDATRVTAGDSSWQGHTSDDYWAFVGPFGGVAAAAILRALIEHPERAGDPLALAGTYSKLWISDREPRKLDMPSLMSMSDAFFGRIFHARRELVPFGTVSLTTYFHTDSEELAAEDITRVLATADSKIMHKSYADQNAELWSPNGRLLATPTQIAYFKA